MLPWFFKPSISLPPPLPPPLSAGSASPLPLSASSPSPPLPPLFLAPMAGFTDTVFRELCKQHGADVLVTEFVQSEGLERGGARVWETLDFGPSQRPLGVQIFGAKPDSMARAAQMVEERTRPDFIDLNFGCPAVNVVEQNAGAGLLREPELLEKIARAVVGAVPGTPVTAKMRLGWDSANIVAVDIARRLEDAGVQMLTVHGRTRAQAYSGVADWGEIARVAAAVALPVVGNGDIRDGAGALARWRESGVAGLMVGRGAQGNPWIFDEIKAALSGLPAPPTPTEAERRALLLEYAAGVVRSRVRAEDGGAARGDAAAAGGGTARVAAAENDAVESAAVRWFLPRLQAFTRGVSGGRVLRSQLSACDTLADLRRLIAGTGEHGQARTNTD
jgi:nifR3 family TIM-barrel protein